MKNQSRLVFFKNRLFKNMVIKSIFWKNRFSFPLLITALITTLLIGCGGHSGAKTQAVMPSGTDSTTILNYTGPVAASKSVQSFKTELWDNLVENNRCSACHGVGGQTPSFARNDDINAAYNAALSVVDLADPAQSRMVQKVAGGHNCWVADVATCGDLMTRWISNWAQQTGGVAARVVVLKAPEIHNVGTNKTFPENSSLFASKVYPLLKEYCVGCHNENARVPQSPFFASDDVSTAYNAAKSKINLETPADSRFVVRLRDEFHNCWSNCAANATEMLNAITSFANDPALAPQPVDPSLVISKAMFLLGDGIVANSGGRYESNVIALYEFKTGSGAIAYDTSGKSPALNLTLSDGVSWVGGWGLRFAGGTAKAQGQVAASKKIAQAIKRTGEYSIEAWVVPGNVTQGDEDDRADTARIVSYSANTAERNFTLGQSLYSYDFLHRSSTTDVNGLQALSTDSADKVLQASLQHVVLTYDVQSGRRIYVDGKLVVNQDVVAPGSLSDWDENFALVLGNETSGNRSWQGVIRMLAVHDRALTLSQVQQNFEVGVGQKYLLLFSLQDLTSIPDAYVVFEVSQFDDYSYLFSQPYFISLKTGATITNTTIKGMRIGINGKEASVGQAYRNLDFTLSGSNYDSTGTPLSDLGTVIALEKGPESDEFFLTFEQFGSKQHVVTDTTGVAPTPVDQTPSPDIGLRTFDEISATMSRLTTVSNQQVDVKATYQTIRQQLPSVEVVDTFVASQQVAVAQLAIAYCDALVESNALRSAYFPGFNFSASASSAFDVAGRNLVINPLLSHMLGQNLATQPATAEVTGELNDLIDTLTQCGGGCAADRTKTVVKASCAAVLGSASTLFQ